MRWYVWLPGLATMISVPFSAYVYLSDSPVIAYGCCRFHTFWAIIWLRLSPWLRGWGLRMRALASSIILFIANIIGLGLGPQFTGIASDILFVTTDLGQDSLRWASSTEPDI